MWFEEINYSEWHGNRMHLLYIKNNKINKKMNEKIIICNIINRILFNIE